METEPTDRTPKRKPNGHWLADSNSRRVCDVDFTPSPLSREDVLADWRRGFDSIDVARCWLMYALTHTPHIGREERAEDYLAEHCQWNDEWEARIEQRRRELGCKDVVPQFRFDQFPLLTVEWEADASTPPSRGLSTRSGLIEERLEFILPRKTDWVWKNYIPAGRITVLAGDPGLGKSTLGIDIVSRISRGCDMPDGTPSTELGACAIATAEDDTAETIVPRVMAAEGDRKKIRVIRKVLIAGEYRFLSLPRDTQRVYEYIKSNNLKLFLIDPLNAFMGSTLDTYKDHDVRLALSPIEDIAEETGCAIGVISHLNKKEDAATLYRVGGSTLRTSSRFGSFPIRCTRLTYGLKP